MAPFLHLGFVSIWNWPSLGLFKNQICLESWKVNYFPIKIHIVSSQLKSELIRSSFKPTQFDFLFGLAYYMSNIFCYIYRPPYSQNVPLELTVSMQNFAVARVICQKVLNFCLLAKPWIFTTIWDTYQALKHTFQTRFVCWNCALELNVLSILKPIDGMGKNCPIISRGEQNGQIGWEVLN